MLLINTDFQISELMSFQPEMEGEGEEGEHRREKEHEYRIGECD